MDWQKTWRSLVRLATSLINFLLVKGCLHQPRSLTHFNSGAASKITVLKTMGLEVPASTLSFVRKKDSSRIKNAAYKISLKACKQRQRLRSLRKSKADKNSYAAGSFGLTTKPESYTNTSSNPSFSEKQSTARSPSKNITSNNPSLTAQTPSTPTGPVIVFVDDQSVQMIRKY